MQPLDHIPNWTSPPQAQSDEKALIAKLHQHIVALQLSETTAISRLEAANTRLQKLEAQKLRVEQQLDAQQQTLWHARQEGHQRARHLRHTIQALRRQFSGALPLAQQEKFSSTMLQLQEDKARARDEAHNAEEEKRKAEGKAQELKLKLKGLEELIATLKDAKGAQKVSWLIDWFQVKRWYDSYNHILHIGKKLYNFFNYNLK